MADMRTRLQRAAAEAESPEDRAWAASRFRELYGESHDAPVERFDMRTGQAPALDPLDAAIKRRAAQQPKPQGGAETAMRGFFQGASGMHGDELAGSSGAYGVGGFGLPGLSLSGVRDAAIERERAGDPTGTRTYDEVRNANRAADAQGAAENPAAYYPPMILGALAMPGPKGAPKGAGLGTRLAANTGAGVVTGLATGVGASDKEDPGDIAEDALASGALSGGLSFLGTAAGAPFKYLYDKLGKSAPTRIANEAAEGATQKTTATARSQLFKAKEGLADEVIEGPQGDTVRSALRGPAADAPAKLKPRLDDLSTQRDAAYTAFEEAGKGTLDPGAYRAALVAAAKAERKPSMRKGFQKLVAEYDEWADSLAADGSPLTLRDVREFTTDIQGLAASAIGSVNEKAATRIKDRMAAVATKSMDDLLEASAAGDEGLQAAAQSLREANKGMSPLLTAKTALKQRAKKEASEGQGFRTLGKQVSMAATPAALGAVTAEEGDKLENAALYGGGALALQRALPALGGLMDRGITGASIFAARHPNSRIPEIAGRATRPFVPPLSLNIMDALMQRRREQEK
jgi:hypothetical protein